MIFLTLFVHYYILYRYNRKTKNAPSNKKTDKQIEKLHTKIKKDLEEFL